jgi:LPXTG-motif cell wall-anchored protein
MSMMDAGMQQTGGGQGAGAGGPSTGAQGADWLLFAGIMMALIAILNIIYGIAAIGDSHFFVDDQAYILSNLSTWGWITLAIGAIQLVAAFSIWNGHQFGRWIGIAVASASAIAALLSIPAYPFWSLAIFAVDILVIYALAAYGGRGKVTA